MFEHTLIVITAFNGCKANRQTIVKLSTSARSFQLQGIAKIADILFKAALF